MVVVEAVRALSVLSRADSAARRILLDFRTTHQPSVPLLDRRLPARRFHGQRRAERDFWYTSLHRVGEVPVSQSYDHHRHRMNEDSRASQAGRGVRSPRSRWTLPLAGVDVFRALDPRRLDRLARRMRMIILTSSG